MDIIVYNFSKRTNSTKRPTGGTTINNVVLKTPCDVLSPVLELTKMPSLANYAFIPKLGRYYWIESIERKTNAVDVVKLSVDVLATYRDNILSSNQYVLRSSSNYDTSIMDTWYPQKSGCTVLTTKTEFYTYDTECYMLGVVSKSAESVTGATQYALMYKGQVKELLDFLFTPENFTSEIVDDVVKTFFNPFQYITDCMYFPFNPKKDLGLNDLKLGWFEPKGSDGQNVACTYIKDKAWKGSTLQVAIPRPISGDINDYRNYAPFCTYRMYIPFAGWINLDANLLKGQTAIDIIGTLDYPTGTLLLEIRSVPSANIITTIECQCATKIPLAQVSYSQSILSGASAIIGGIAEGASNVLDLIGFDSASEKVSGIGDSIRTAGKQVSTKGQMGCIAQSEFIWDIILECDYFSSVQTDREDFGSPCCKTLNIGSLSGYCRCLDPHIAISTAFKGELEAIENYLKGGVYID